jgi:hypothetical protein
VKCLVLGGGGTVGIALLYLFKKSGWTVCVVDPLTPAHFPLHEKQLHGTLLGWTTHAYTLAMLDDRLQSEDFDAVIDLAPTLDKRGCLAVCDKHGVSLVNATMVAYGKDVHAAARDFISNRPVANRRPHIVAAGMNPGALNAIAEEIIQANNRPERIVYWEYDDTAPADGTFREPSITWCPCESAQEIDEDKCFEVVEKDSFLLHNNALEWEPQDFRSCGAPLDRLRVPPAGDALLIGHEECIYMGWRHDTSCKFIYGLHPENMKLIRKASGNLEVSLLRQSQAGLLRGGDMVGVACRFDGHWRGAYCHLDNSPAIALDTNATSVLVASGIAASVSVLANNHVPHGVHLTHEVENFMPAFRSLVPVHNYEMRADPNTAR